MRKAKKLLFLDNSHECWFLDRFLQPMSNYYKNLRNLHFSDCQIFKMYLNWISVENHEEKTVFFFAIKLCITWGLRYIYLQNSDTFGVQFFFELINKSNYFQNCKKININDYKKKKTFFRYYNGIRFIFHLVKMNEIFQYPE